MKLRHTAKALLDTFTPALALRLRQLRGYENELDFLPYLVRRSAIAVDVGANHGLYAAALATLARRCLAVEPNIDLAKKLMRSLPGNCDIYQVALSNRHGEAFLRIPTIDGRENLDRATLATENLLNQYEERSVPVPLATLDSLVGSLDVGFIKIDVEGHEEEVLEGTGETLHRCRPNLLIEIEERHRPGALQRIQIMLEKLRYKMMFLEKGALRPISEFDAIKHQNVANQGRRSSYINNFIFLA